MSTPLELIDILGRASQLGSAPSPPTSSSSSSSLDGSVLVPVPSRAGQRLLLGRTFAGGFPQQPPQTGGHFKLHEKQHQKPPRLQDPLLAVQNFAPVKPLTSDVTFDSAFEVSVRSADEAAASLSNPDAPLSPVPSGSSAPAKPSPSPPSSSPAAAKPKKRTWKKPVGKPRRPLSAYNLFFKSERAAIVEAKDREIALAEGIDPDKDSSSGGQQLGKGGRPGSKKRPHRRSHGKIGFAALAQTISAKWKTLDDDTKAPFEAKALVEKERYRKEIDIWQKKRAAEGKSIKSESKFVLVDEQPSGGEHAKSSSGKKRRTSKTASKENEEKGEEETKERPQKKVRPCSEQDEPKTKEAMSLQSQAPSESTDDQEESSAAARRAHAHSLLDSLEPIDISSMEAMQQQQPPPQARALPPKIRFHEQLAPVPGATSSVEGMNLRSMLLLNQMKQRQVMEQQEHLRQYELRLRAQQAFHFAPHRPPISIPSVTTKATPPRSAPEQQQQLRMQEEEGAPIDPFDANLDAIFDPSCEDSAPSSSSSGGSSSGLDDSLHCDAESDSLDNMDDAFNMDLDAYFRTAEGGCNGGLVGA